MPRLFIQSLPKGKSIKITGEEARYILTVLRQAKGDELTLFDPGGNCYKAEILEIGTKEVYAEIKASYTPLTESRLRLILVQGILKARKMDLVVQKAVELGVKQIIPLITERAEVKETRKQGRWQKIALEASRQSGRTYVPLVKAPIKFAEFFSAKEPIKGFIFWEEGGMAVKEAVKGLTKMFDLEKDSLFLVIGPEGGFTKEEIMTAEKAGLYRVSMGNRILRAETAAIAVLAIIQTLIGDMGDETQRQAFKSTDPLKTLL